MQRLLVYVFATIAFTLILLGTSAFTVPAHAYKAGADVTFTGKLVYSSNNKYDHQLEGQNVNLIIGSAYDSYINQTVIIKVHYYQNGRFYVNSLTPAEPAATGQPKEYAPPETTSPPSTPKPTTTATPSATPTPSPPVSSGRSVSFTGILTKEVNIPGYNYQLLGKDVHLQLDPAIYDSWTGKNVQVTAEYQDESHFRVIDVKQI